MNEVMLPFLLHITVVVKSYSIGSDKIYSGEMTILRACEWFIILYKYKQITGRVRICT